MSPLSVPNSSPIGVRIRVLLRILQSVRKEVEETPPPQTLAARIFILFYFFIYFFFICSYLGNGWSDFLQI